MSDETRTDPDLPSGLREPEPDGDERRCRCRAASPREHRDLLATVEALSVRVAGQDQEIGQLRSELARLREQLSGSGPTSRSPGLQRSRGSEPDLHRRG